MRKRIPVCLAMVGLVLAGCGTDERAAAEKQRAVDEQRQKREQARQEREDAQKRVDDARSVAEECEQQMGDLLDETRELDSRLDIGLNYDEYTDKVGDLKVAYDNIDFAGAEDSFRCLQEVGLPLEAAANSYQSAAVVWDDCFDDISCDNDSISPELQRKWARASRKADEAQDGIRALQDEVDDAEAELADLR